MEPIETLNLNTTVDEIKLNIDDAVGEGNSIAGVELLANSNRIKPKDDHYENLNDLENSLNELVNEPDNRVDNNNMTKTWDGYSKIESIPENTSRREPTNTEDILREKFKYVRMLEDLEKKGVSLSKKYDMESSLMEMQGEYETIIGEKERDNSVKFQGKMLMAFITGVEFMNNKFDPFDIKIDGWGEQVNENLAEYDDIFGELFEKYKSKGKLAPEIKLMFQLAGSAIMIHMTNTMFKSSMPGMDDIMRQNPDLMHQFTKAAVDQMSQKNQGFGNFMNMSNAMPASRPDLNFAQEETDPPNKSFRQEMRGPTDISDLLSGLKRKDEDGDGDTISVQDMQEVENKNKPYKSKRRGASEKNTISLNL